MRIAPSLAKVWFVGKEGLLKWPWWFHCVTTHTKIPKERIISSNFRSWCRKKWVDGTCAKDIQLKTHLICREVKPAQLVALACGCSLSVKLFGEQFPICIWKATLMEWSEYSRDGGVPHVPGLSEEHTAVQPASKTFCLVLEDIATGPETNRPLPWKQAALRIWCWECASWLRRSAHTRACRCRCWWTRWPLQPFQATSGWHTITVAISHHCRTERIFWSSRTGHTRCYKDEVVRRKIGTKDNPESWRRRSFTTSQGSNIIICSMLPSNLKREALSISGSLSVFLSCAEIGIIRLCYTICENIPSKISTTQTRSKEQKELTALAGWDQPVGQATPRRTTLNQVVHGCKQTCCRISQLLQKNLLWMLTLQPSASSREYYVQSMASDSTMSVSDGAPTKSKWKELASSIPCPLITGACAWTVVSWQSSSTDCN